MRAWRGFSLLSLPRVVTGVGEKVPRPLACRETVIRLPDVWSPRASTTFEKSVYGGIPQNKLLRAIFYRVGRRLINQSALGLGPVSCNFYVIPSPNQWTQ